MPSSTREPDDDSINQLAQLKFLLDAMIQISGAPDQTRLLMDARASIEQAVDSHGGKHRLYEVLADLEDSLYVLRFSADSQDPIQQLRRMRELLSEAHELLDDVLAHYRRPAQDEGEGLVES